MDFNEAVSKGKVIVVAGAGISKDPPSNLPSWWDYNCALLEMIGKIGSEKLGESKNLIDISLLMEKLSSVSISEFLVDRIAGDSYYPLL